MKGWLFPAATLALAGCAAPPFDVPYASATGGKEQPNITSIIQRITCELTDMVREPLNPANGRVTNALERDLLTGDYDVQIQLVLEVNDTGGLAPSITFMEPVNKLISFGLGGTATLQESRDHTFTDNFQLSMRKLYADAQQAKDADWIDARLKENGIYAKPEDAPEAKQAFADQEKAFAERWGHVCPATADTTNLARTLGVQDFVAMGFNTSRSYNKPVPASGAPAPSALQMQAAAQNPTSITTATEAFGGAVRFVVTRSISGFGPTWTTTRWKGPGGLAGLSRVNTDTVTLGFAQGPNAGQGLILAEDIPPADVKANGPNLGAYSFIQEQNVQSLSTQIQTLRNALTP